MPATALTLSSNETPGTPPKAFDHAAGSPSSPSQNPVSLGLFASPKTEPSRSEVAMLETNFSNIFDKLLSSSEDEQCKSVLDLLQKGKEELLIKEFTRRAKETTHSTSKMNPLIQLYNCLAGAALDDENLANTVQKMEPGIEELQHHLPSRPETLTRR